MSFIYLFLKNKLDHEFKCYDRKLIEYITSFLSNIQPNYLFFSYIYIKLFNIFNKINLNIKQNKNKTNLTNHLLCKYMYCGFMVRI